MDEFEQVFGADATAATAAMARSGGSTPALKELPAIAQWLDAACETGYDLLYLEYDPERS